MSTTQLVIVIAAITLGAAIQSVVGFGMNLVAVPIALMIGADEVVPGALLVVLFVQAFTLLGRDADRRLLSWFLPVRVVGTAAGTLVAARASGDVTVVLICTIVIGAVAMSMRGWRVPQTPTAFMATGFASGFSNVLSSIGGPPLALTLTDHSPSQQRATQGWSALFGSVMSIGLLLAADRFDGEDVRLGLVMLPVTLLGSYGMRPLRRRLPTADAVRPVAWAIAIIGSVAAMLRVLVT